MLRELFKVAVGLALLFRLPIVCEALGATLIVYVVAQALRPTRSDEHDRRKS